DGTSPAWPIGYDDVAPYYDRAEELFQVHGGPGDPTEPEGHTFPFAPVPHAAGMSAIVGELERMGLHPSPLPLGVIRPGDSGGCVLCNTCNSFPCRIHRKSDAEVCCVEPAVAHSNVEIWTGAKAERLLTDPTGRNVEALLVTRGNETV